MTSRLQRWLIAIVLGLALCLLGTPSLHPAFAAGGTRVNPYSYPPDGDGSSRHCQCGW